MLKKVFFAVAVAVTVFLLIGPALCQEQTDTAVSAPVEEKVISRNEVLDIAARAVKSEGIELNEVNIIYDEGGKLWNERTGLLTGEDKSPNHGILRKGFLKNYFIVYYDFKEPVKDVWVFIDKDTGEVLTVYREQ